MEHPCYRCQALVDEGIAFCPHCGAPQIRVAPPEESQPLTPPPPPAEFPSPVQPAFPPEQWSQSGTIYPPPPPNAIRWELAWRGALLAGIGAALLSAVPIVAIGCCLWMLGAGAISVWMYQRRVPATVITPGMGMRLGALTGVIAFAVNAAVTTVSFLALRSTGDFRRTLQEQMEKQMANNPDPRAQEMVQRMMDWMITPQGAASLIVLVLLFMAVMFVVFCGAGGAVGASMFGRRREFR
jgi:hypothetical protein